MSSLTLRAGPEALAHIRERGLRPADVSVVPGASGGPKWLVLAGIDRYVIGEWLLEPRTRPLHLVGSSIGSWRMACLAQRDSRAALDRAHAAYLEQRYPHRPSPTLVSETSARILDVLLGPAGADEILDNQARRLHVIAAQCRGLTASERRYTQLAGFALMASMNALSRRSIGLQARRVVFHAQGDASLLAHLGDLPTRHAVLTRANLAPALLASASIPLVLDGVQVPGIDGGPCRDGGLTDYHLDIDYGIDEGIVFYPHFSSQVITGWFDRSLPWRRARQTLRRTLLVAPSPGFVASLPFGKIPDRRDFYTMDDATRIRAWQTVMSASERMGDELRQLIERGRLADAVQPIEGTGQTTS